MGENECDVVVIGAGAAGLMASIFAARGGAHVIALDGARKIGAKILISGGGRCNVTNATVKPDDFNASNLNMLARVLRSFGVTKTVEFFSDLGVELKTEETGKLFPVSDKARTVLDALVSEARRAGADIRSDSRVKRIDVCDDGSFAVGLAGGVVIAQRVVVATGGRSVPRTGSDGLGYEMARSFGHSVTNTFPALVPLLLEEGHWLTDLKGIATDVELRLTNPNGKLVRRVSGSMLFAHFGLTGPAALDMSRHWISCRNDGLATRLAVSFLPGEAFESVEAWIMQGAKTRARLSVAGLVRSRLQERLATSIVTRTGLPSERMLGQLTRDDRRILVRHLTDLELPIVGDRGFAVAEVTAGGVPLEEVNLRTMESKCQTGLYLCGEILDVDGRIGGFNFQWAWASGRLAGMGSGGA